MGGSKTEWAGVRMAVWTSFTQIFAWARPGARLQIGKIETPAVSASQTMAGGWQMGSQWEILTDRMHCKVVLRVRWDEPGLSDRC